MTKAITNAKIYTITNGVIENGTILIKDGKIEKVGENIAIPDSYEVIDAEGMIVTPGIVDAHAHVEIWEEGIGWEGMDVNESTDPVTAGIRAIDGINPDGMGMKDAVSGGVTTIWDAPGSANVIGGYGVTLKTHGKTIDDMVMLDSSGLKAAFGENPKGAYGQRQDKMPMTRMAVAAILREELIKGQEYLEDIEKANGDMEKMPKKDLGLEAIGKVLKKEIPLKTHCHRHDDIMTVIRIANEFDIDISIEHATQAHIIVDELAKHKVPLIVGPTVSTRSKPELSEMSFKTAGICAKAGIPVSIMTDHPIIPVHHLHLAAAMCVKHGMEEEHAFEAITINPAKTCGVADRVGSIEVGKDADLVIWTKHPFNVFTQVKHTLIDGEVVYSIPQDEINEVNLC